MTQPVEQQALGPVVLDVGACYRKDSLVTLLALVLNDERQVEPVVPGLLSARALLTVGPICSHEYNQRRKTRIKRVSAREAATCRHQQR